MTFEESYIALRKKEGRLYSDEEVAGLPIIAKDHPLSAEWKLRQDQYLRFTRYIEREQWITTTVEIGCGNGWLCSRIQEAGGSYVWGIDTNVPELEQARRIFCHNNKLAFLQGSVELLSQSKMEPELIVMAGAIQYFRDLPGLIGVLLSHLHEDGEIHIFDSPFYKEEEKASAKKRSDAYYAQMGFPEMSTHYHHHSYDDLKRFNPRLLYKPSAIKRFIGKLRSKRVSPFPWIVIKKSVNLKE
jgi:SAM-dependent methyltransferase